MLVAIGAPPEQAVRYQLVVVAAVPGALAAWFARGLLCTPRSWRSRYDPASSPMRAFAFLTIVGLAAPAAAQTHPFPGVTMVRDGGGTMIVADLCAAGVSVRATRYGEGRATPGAWGARGDVGAAIAINGDFYDFPSAASVSGRARAAGEDWPPGTQNVNPEVRSYWQFGPHLAGLVAPSTIAPPGPPAVTEIVGAHNVIIRGGRSLAPDFDGDGVLQSAHARTAIGLSADGRYLYLFATRTLMTGTALANAVLGYAARGAAPGRRRHQRGRRRLVADVRPGPRAGGRLRAPGGQPPRHKGHRVWRRAAVPAPRMPGGADQRARRPAPLRRADGLPHLPRGLRRRRAKRPRDPQRQRRRRLGELGGDGALDREWLRVGDLGRGHADAHAQRGGDASSTASQEF